MFLCNFAILVSTSSVYAAGTWRSDLDWVGFAATLSSKASLIDTEFSDYLDECLPEFRDKAFDNRTNYALIDQPSGMCVSQFFCAYERCWPRPNASTSTQAQRVTDEADLFYASFGHLSPETRSWLEDPQNPSLNLPSKVLFPGVASDVVEAIQFARENGLEISVKNSGHSFIGASTKKDTLHLNMNRFQEYSPTSIVDCATGDLPITDMQDQPCSLAAARNKPAFIRVGGGENWDEVYRAVEAANIEQGNKYHVIGGAAGTVSPMGWTFQGGLAGTQGGRKYGFGVDQVLQVEMVLPNGQHVKFGPVEWEDASADGFIVPKTTHVGGVCRSNPKELDENQWEWIECSEGLGINFDDLWFAVNGGGGGTWGVVTSIYLQVHDYLPSRIFGLSFIDFLVVDDCDFATKSAIGPFFEAFRLRYVLAPSTLNVSQADSDACGMADPGSAGILACFGDGPYQTLVDEWKKFATAYFDPATYNISLVDALACPGTVESTWLEAVKYPEATGFPYGGQAADFPSPTIPSVAGAGVVNVVVPQKWIEENFEAWINLWLYIGGNMYLAFGSGSASASDQANSLGSAHRMGGFKSLTGATEFFGTLMGDMFDVSNKTNFPSIQGSNHIGSNHMGPLKDDWTTACPDEWTQEERDEKCVSIQETIYGTEVLARLEAIKKAIDPNHMFDCTGCIGNNRKKDTTATTTTTDGKYDYNHTTATATNATTPATTTTTDYEYNQSNRDHVQQKAIFALTLFNIYSLITF